MKICELFQSDKPMLSFEVFPPKTDSGIESVRSAVETISDFKPDYMSVTYGAGGDGGRYTADIAAHIKSRGVTPLAHMTCVSATKESVKANLSTLRDIGVQNILALRGDLPDGYKPGDYRYAADLIADIKKYGDFCVGAACYPEGHPESASQKEDIRYLRQKVDAGCCFLTTQMFFDNNIFYNFMYKIREAGIHVPVVAGIMPITAASQVKRVIELSGCFVPRDFAAIVDHFASDDEAMYAAGIAYATGQIIDLFANGVTHVHIYSMNKPDVAGAIYQNVHAILGKPALGSFQMQGLADR
ncbi:MAG: methylenetetrahydrofolate reductase [Eubacteriaceae bacterium]|nr:methylenetetrahydrofolate reductase [NAD(P)H] [Eubacteriaceae bacterium]